LSFKLNGDDLIASQREKYMKIICVEVSELSESEFADWIKAKIIELIHVLLKITRSSDNKFLIDGCAENC
jgi:hypothetical protein